MTNPFPSSYAHLQTRLDAALAKRQKFDKIIEKSDDTEEERQQREIDQLNYDAEVLSGIGEITKEIPNIISKNPGKAERRKTGMKGEEREVGVPSIPNQQHNYMTNHDYNKICDYTPNVDRAQNYNGRYDNFTRQKQARDEKRWKWRAVTKVIRFLGKVLGEYLEGVMGWCFVGCVLCCCRDYFEP